MLGCGQAARTRQELPTSPVHRCYLPPAHGVYIAHMPGHHHQHVCHAAVLRPGHAVLLRVSGPM